MWLIFQICFFRVRHDHLDRLQYSYGIKKNEVWNYKSSLCWLRYSFEIKKKKKKVNNLLHTVSKDCGIKIKIKGFFRKPFDTMV